MSWGVGFSAPWSFGKPWLNTQEIGMYLNREGDLMEFIADFKDS
jgi:hypothetical protein